MGLRLLKRFVKNVLRIRRIKLKIRNFFISFCLFCIIGTVFLLTRNIKSLPKEDNDISLFAVNIELNKVCETLNNGKVKVLSDQCPLIIGHEFCLEWEKPIDVWPLYKRAMENKCCKDQPVCNVLYDCPIGTSWPVLDQNKDNVVNLYDISKFLLIDQH